jgi:hypothetical protein
MAAVAFTERPESTRSAEYRREMNMALRAPMLLLLSGTFVGGVAATHFAPKVLSTLLESGSATEAVVAPAEAAAAPQQVNEAQPAKEAAVSDCKDAAWPYLDRNCAPDADKAERHVRVIATGRDAPSRVPIPAPPATQVASVTQAPSPEPVAAEPAIATPTPVALNASEAAPVAPVTALPREKPASAPRREIVAKAAVPAPPAPERVASTGSISPAAPALAKPQTPARRQVARVQRSRHDMERIRQARRNFDEDDTVVQTTTYQYADGRQLVFSSEPRQQERRRWAAEQPDEPIRRIEPQPAQPGRDGLLGWLLQ